MRALIRKAPITAVLTAALVAGVVIPVGPAVARALVTGADVKNESLTGADLKDGTVRGVDIANGSITLSDLAPAARPAASKVLAVKSLHNIDVPAFSPDVTPRDLFTLTFSIPQGPRRMVEFVGAARYGGVQPACNGTPGKGSLFVMRGADQLPAVDFLAQGTHTVRIVQVPTNCPETKTIPIQSIGWAVRLV